MASVVFVAGARPNFVKIAPILRALGACSSSLRAELVHTGQHYDFAMSGVFFEQLGIPAPHVHLEVGSGPHGAQAGQIMARFEEHLLARPRRPAGVVVVGDVNSTMACALAATKLGIPVAHVEAGLRSFDRTMPEEINRVVTDAVADLLLVSEPSGLVNLRAEGVAEAKLRYVGNVMIDSLVHQLPAAREARVPDQMGLEHGGYALVTLHRPSNVDDPSRLAALVELLCRIARDLEVVFPLHPRTERRLVEHGLMAKLAACERIHRCPPQGYREFLSLMAAARVVASDSGGVQEETTYLGVPCITLRSTTERPITITHGSNVLAGSDLATVAEVLAKALATAERRPATIEGWDGRAAERIVDLLAERWGRG